MARKSTEPKDEAVSVTDDDQVNVTPSPATENEQDNVTPSPATENEQDNVTPSPAVDDDQGSNAPATEEDPFVGTHVVNTARGLNLRQRPSFGAKVLEVLPVGTSVQNIGAENVPAGWLFVMTEDGKAGFVVAKYVSPVEE